MASRTGIDKIRFVHGLNDIAKDFVAGYMSVDLIDHPEFFYVEVDEGVILYTVVHRHLKEGDEMIPGIVVSNVIYICFFEKVILFEAFKVVIYDVYGPVFIDPHIAEDPDLLAAQEHADNIGIFLHRQVAAGSVRIVVISYLTEDLMNGIDIDLDIVIDLY